MPEMNWTNTNCTRFRVSHASGVTGMEHHGDILISKSIYHHLYTKGRTVRDIWLDMTQDDYNAHVDAGTLPLPDRTDIHVAPSDKWQFPASAMNRQFYEVRRFVRYASEYFCLSQIDKEADYTITVGQAEPGNEVNTSGSLDFFLGLGEVTVDGDTVEAPIMIENAASKTIVCTVATHHMVISLD